MSFKNNLRLNLLAITLLTILMITFNTINLNSQKEENFFSNNRSSPSTIYRKQTIFNSDLFNGSSNVIDAKQIQFGSALSLNNRGKVYMYGMATGGGTLSSVFSTGQLVSGINADGYVSSGLSITSVNSNNFTTGTAYYSIGGIGEIGNKYVGVLYDSNVTAGASSAIVHFSLNETALVIVLAVTSSQQYMTVQGLPNFITDAASGNGSAITPIIIGHTVLTKGNYTTLEKTQPDAPSQDPNHMTDTLGIFAFANVSDGFINNQIDQIPTFLSNLQQNTNASQPIISSVSSIRAINNQTIIISGSGFGTNPVYVLSGDGGYDTNNCNNKAPSLAIIDMSGGSHDWSAGRETCSNFDSIGLYFTSWSDNQIILGGFGSALGVNNQSSWIISPNDSLLILVYNPLLVNQGSLYVKVNGNTTTNPPVTSNNIGFIGSSTINDIIIISVIISAFIIAVILILNFLKYYKSERNNMDEMDLSIISVDDIFNKSLLLYYIYGRLKAFFNRIGDISNEMNPKTFLITSSKLDTSNDKDIPNLRLGHHGKKLMQEMTGLSLMILLEFADSYPSVTTLTNITKSLKKPKSTIKTQIDKLLSLDYINTLTSLLTDPQYLDRRYKNFKITESGIDFLKTLKKEIEDSGILYKSIS